MKRYSESISARWTGRHEVSLEAAGDLRGKRILDIGCGNGWFEAGAVKRGCRLAIGIDLDPGSLVSARREVPAAAFLRTGPPELPFTDGQFDLAVMWEVLEHLPKKREGECLLAARRALKPGGRLFLSTPKLDPRAVLSDPAWYLGHRHYTRSKLLDTLARGGFRPLRVWSAGGFFEVLSMLLLYPCKWLLGREVPGKEFFEKRRRREYRRAKGWSTWFVEAELTPGQTSPADPINPRHGRG